MITDDAFNTPYLHDYKRNLLLQITLSIEPITTIRKCLVSSKDISVSLILLALIIEVNQNILQRLYTRER
ncbi:hypothetical protein Bca101_027034 [Brassica carinata]